MTAKLFPRRRTEGPPSTQFAATIVAMPDAVDAADAPSPDTLSPDSVVTDASGAQAAMPDVVTDIGGLPSEVPDPADAPTISHIGRYALKRQLGAGGLGAVFEAWDPLLSRAVAVKTLQLGVDAAAGSSLDGLFLNEARAAAGLNHRYIVTIHDAGLSPHGVYIAMERLYGRDLQRALADGWRPTVEQAVQLVRRVTEALAYAHARGVVHCDIKPANIFLQRKDRPKVLDFGIARIVHGAALPALEGAMVGSPRYRAPEQLTGGAVDARTDLFSLGVVMYELLTRRRAFEGDTLVAINRAVLEHDPMPAHEVDPAIPREVSAIVARLMARDPARRYTCASELAADLRRWMHEQQVQAETVTMTALPAAATAVAPAASRMRPARWLLAGALLMAAGAVAVGLGGRARAPAAVTSAAAPAAAAIAAPLPALAPTSPAAAATPPVARDETAAPPAAPAVRVPSLSTPATTPVAMPQRRPADAPARPRAALPEPAARGDEAAAVPAASPATGALNLAVSPWGEVEVDGTAAGTTPPLTRLTLPAGTHTITLRNADFPPHTVQVQVSADKPVTLRHRFGS